MTFRTIRWGTAAVLAPVAVVLLAGCASMQGEAAGEASPTAGATETTTQPPT